MYAQVYSIYVQIHPKKSSSTERNMSASQPKKEVRIPSLHKTVDQQSFRNSYSTCKHLQVTFKLTEKVPQSRCKCILGNKSAIQLQPKLTKTLTKNNIKHKQICHHKWQCEIK